jgi:hypothetical protein
VGSERKERRKAGIYGGCILYAYMKIEKFNLLKLFSEGSRGGRGRMKRGSKSN